MIAPQNMGLVSNYINAGIVITTALQALETIRPIKGKGLVILFGDFLMLGAVPWIIQVMVQRGTLIDILLPIAIGTLLSIPLILSTKIIMTPDGKVRFKKNIFLYIFLICTPILRRKVAFTEFFQSHPIFIVNTHIPDVELMVVMYLTVITINIMAWRIISYLKFKKTKRELSSLNY